MKTAVISDIHIDINKDYEVIEAISEYVRDNGAELLLIAGDISNCVTDTLSAVRRLEKESGAKVLYVPGNHDMWDEKSAYAHNDEIYRLYLEDEHCLSGKAFETEKSWIVGDLGWYDYSFGNRNLHTFEEFEKMKIGTRTVQDSLFNVWSRDNTGRCAWFVDRLKEQLDKNPGKDIVLVTHMLSHEFFLVPESREQWSYLNAFMGSESLKQLCLEYNVKYAICGHIHYRKDTAQANTTWLCRCLNYQQEWLGEKDVRKQVAEAMEILDL
ncbi:MAG: metallophosphoesterase [Lachnospiraceae bacterium]|nr:metallophosphoesterase [Lachnospiraceae bacterium]